MVSDLALAEGQLPGANQQVPPVDKHQNLTFLVLSMPAAEPEVAELLFHWPAHLKRVGFRDVQDKLYEESYSTPVIERLLGIHRDTLERIQPPTITDYGLPDVSVFPKLSEVQLNSICFFNATLEDEISKLHAPDLRRLVIGLVSGHPDRFNEKQAGLLQHFVTAQRSPLEQIVLQFGPEDALARERIQLDPQSANRVQTVSAVAALYDISLAYNKPVPLGYSFNWNPQERKVLNAVIKTPSTNGVHPNAIIKKTKLPPAEVQSILGELVEEDMLETTIDDNTYAEADEPGLVGPFYD